MSMTTTQNLDAANSSEFTVRFHFKHKLIQCMKKMFTELHCYRTETELQNNASCMLNWSNANVQISSPACGGDKSEMKI